MRSGLVVLLGIACGCGVGVATAWARYGNASAALAPSSEAGDVIGGLKPRPDDQPQPRVSVEQDEFDFGELQLGSEAEHLFRIKNTGVAPLHMIPQFVPSHVAEPVFPLGTRQELQEAPQEPVDVLLTQVPQSCVPDGHRQLPWHVLPFMHCVPQLPQLLGSLAKFTHTLPVTQ